jgi:hypothetical protein
VRLLPRDSMKNTYFLVVLSVFGALAAPAQDPAGTFKQYCFGCHGKAAMGGVNLEKLFAEASMAESFAVWEKVAGVLEARRMPPPKMPEPSEAQRGHAAAWVRARLGEYARKHAGDPGRVPLRQLTSAEYGYAVEDLTGLDLNLENDLPPDSVGGEGFTNFGDVQFMQDAALERYLGTAKTVASHAVIGAGPLTFYRAAGLTGRELYAIEKIQKIYTTHGFRAASAEGGLPYGLHRWGRTFYAAWMYKNRAALGRPGDTFATIAAREGVSPKMLEHAWKVLQTPGQTYPTSEAVALFAKMPAVTKPVTPAVYEKAWKGAAEMQQFVVSWPRWLFGAGAFAEGGRGDERNFVLSEESIAAAATQKLRFLYRAQRGARTAKFYISADVANPAATVKPVVIFSGGKVRTRRATDRAEASTKTFLEYLDEKGKAALRLGQALDGVAVGPEEFAVRAGENVAVEFPLTERLFGFFLELDARLADASSGDAVLRLIVTDSLDGSSDSTPASALLANPETEGYKAWKRNVLLFDSLLPQATHGEPTPADRDPIPPPYNNTYNQPERDLYHLKVKYYRHDRFLVEHVLDDATRKELDEAWTDLLTSFEYHDAIFSFIKDKYKLGMGKTEIEELTPEQIRAMPAEARGFVEKLRAEYDEMQRQLAAAQPGHVEQAVALAAKAWRRPLTAGEKDSLRGFYAYQREQGKMDHAGALRALLARILVSPSFLYRVEEPAEVSGTRPLSGMEVASRLSLFLWSSGPDEELLRAASAGELAKPEKLREQARRMLADKKARRFATEFFGQWLGFYRFDGYTGVDTSRFPEFTAELKTAMYEEAVSFFDHIVRNGRPVTEMLYADYAFLNQPLAKHYGVEGVKGLPGAGAVKKVDGAAAFHRGGVLRMGAVLTATSAPLRTSPVKRGDWILRRVLGTPTPPPPANAGTLPADDKNFAGQTIRERLLAHQRNATCAGCHSRIDPLGFPLEKYDPVGRFRATYADGKAIDDTAQFGGHPAGAGVEGLIAYMKASQPQILKNLSHKLIGYALGRTVIASDLPLIETMANAGANAGAEATFGDLIGQIVASPQFRNRRDAAGPEGSAPVHTAATRREEE